MQSHSDTLAPVNAGENQNSESSPTPDVVWGARAIGAVIGRTERQTSHMLDRNIIESAGKKGGRWYAPVIPLKREFGLV